MATSSDQLLVLSFFFATPSEVREVLLSKVGNIIEFREDASAEEYLQSVSSWPSRETSVS